MAKVTLDMNAFKALASDTRLSILKVLDGRKMSLKDISDATSLNKATLHEHLVKLNEAGLVKKKERDGHKWVYYRLSWKGECLLHPENAKIVVMFTSTLFVLCLGIVQFINFAKGKIVNNKVITSLGDGGGSYSPSPGAGDSLAADCANEGLKNSYGYDSGSEGSYYIISSTQEIVHNQTLQYIAIACIAVFCILLVITIWRYKKNKNLSV